MTWLDMLKTKTVRLRRRYIPYHKQRKIDKREKHVTLPNGHR